MTTRTGFYAMLAGLLANGCASSDGFAADTARILSPDGQVQFEIRAPAGRLEYSITFRNKPVIETSPLVFTVDGAEATDGVEFGEVKRYQLKETYPWRGAHARATNHCNGAAIPLKRAKSNLSCAPPAPKGNVTLASQSAPFYGGSCDSWIGRIVKSHAGLPGD